MKKGGATAQVAQYEERLFNNLCFVTREEDIVKKEAEPMNELPDRPDRIEQCQKENSFSGQAGFGIFSGEEGAVCGAPE